MVVALLEVLGGMLLVGLFLGGQFSTQDWLLRAGLGGLATLRGIYSISVSISHI